MLRLSASSLITLRATGASASRFYGSPCLLFVADRLDDLSHVLVTRGERRDIVTSLRAPTSHVNSAGQAPGR